MKTKNYYLLFFVVLTTALSAQTSDLIIKRVHNEAGYYSAAKDETFYFTFVELQVLNNPVDLSNYQAKYTNGHDSNYSKTKYIGSNFPSKYVSGYSGATPIYSDSPATLPVGSSFYFLEMYKASNDSKIKLTNAALYAVFQEYFGFTDTEMMDNKYFTVNSTSNYAFDSSVYHANSVLTIRKGTTPEDVWQGGVVDDTYDIRTTLSPLTIYDASQWMLDQSTAQVASNGNVFQYELVIPNPLSTEHELTFPAVEKEVSVYTLSGELLSSKTVFENYQLPANIETGMYIMKIAFKNGQVETRKIIVN